MIKSIFVFLGFMVFVSQIHGMDDFNLEEDWILLDIGNRQEVSILDKFLDFLSSRGSLAATNAIQVQPALNLPEDLVQYICSFMLKDWRDIFSLFRTNDYYHKMGENTIKSLKSQMKTLDLEFISRMPINLSLVRMIEDSSVYPKLTTLNLRGCGIGDTKRYPFYFSNQKKVDPRGIIISYILKLTNLTHLNLSHNQLSPDFIFFNENLKRLVGQLPLQYLDLSHNNIRRSIEHIGTEMPEKLIFLDLSYNCLGVAQGLGYPFEHFMTFIHTSKSLTHLNLSGTVGDKYTNMSGTVNSDRGRFIEDLMGRENQIRYLDVSNNDLSVSSEFFISLKNNTVLKHLDLSHSKMGCHYVEFLLSLFNKRGYKYLSTLMKSFKETLKDKPRGKDCPKGDIREIVHRKLLLLAERNRENGNIFLARDLLNTWDFRFNDDQMTQIMEILEPMNVSLTHLGLRGVKLSQTNQDMIRLRTEFMSIPGLEVNLKDTYYREDRIWDV